MGISDIGKVSAALTTQIIIDLFHPDYIINFGTCGGNDTSVKICEYYIVEKCCQFDFDLSEIDNVATGYNQDYGSIHLPLFTEGFDEYRKSTLASADRFSFEQKDIDLISSLGCRLRDMEGGAIAQVCHNASIPLIMLKGVTDTYGSGETSDQFYQNLKMVCSGLKDHVISIISKLK